MRRPTALDAIWLTIALSVLSYGYAWAVLIAYGSDPWEGRYDEEAALVFAATFGLIVAVSWLVVFALRPG